MDDMGRKQVFTKTELLDQTKKVLLEYGYDGFQLKLLSEHLSGARSTIYQYYSNKEEIVASCMKHVMEDILQQTTTVDEEDCMKALQNLLTIYLKEAGLHQLLGYAQKINKANSEVAAKDLEFVSDAFKAAHKRPEPGSHSAEQESAILGSEIITYEVASVTESAK